MGLFQRISDILSANLNDMADKFEDPEKLLRQAVREMEASIQEATRETAKVMASHSGLLRELASNERQMADWQRRAEVALGAGDDQLARKAISRKREHEKLVVALRDEAEAAEESSRTLRNQLDGMKAKMAEANRRLATLTARKRAADFRKKLHGAPVALPSDHQAFAKFDRLRQRVELAEAEADALAELNAAPPNQEVTLDSSDDCAGAEIDAELLQLKKEVKARS